MSFNPADVNYAAYLAGRSKMNAHDAADYDQYFIKYLCQQATATGTINTAMVTTAVTNAQTSSKKKDPTF
jgi:hypothetical protein